MAQHQIGAGSLIKLIRTFINKYFYIWTPCVRCLIRTLETEEDSDIKYHKTSTIRHTKSQNLNDSRLVLQLSLSKPLKPDVKSRTKRCSWSSADRRCSSYIWMINKLIAYEGAPYIRGLTVLQLLILHMTHRKSVLHRKYRILSWSPPGLYISKFDVQITLPLLIQIWFHYINQKFCWNLKNHTMYTSRSWHK